jgi:hypothetical protein
MQCCRNYHPNGLESELNQFLKRRCPSQRSGRH